ncbi:hypothetical protein PTSG_06353 [Salpingoeca rosetta]|uniref:Uncharacterized protein n=1 Tax=Salpingoeca rosetta (strain ATCC 50818 / BSB-021) TaxID=946362 RepID=F2UCN6_SALR5|nr:uncharacterized protein PTSG_06353 [Salpingoeca rosetta]EGD74343.1 hypothetical protein PTSG_06353 [Salpingoeca rosetta]|eukprot:XP_004993243.1 hypothetical protein PTSG_06353 [Salpingoeca rosetta]
MSMSSCDQSSRPPTAPATPQTEGDGGSHAQQHQDDALSTGAVQAEGDDAHDHSSPEKGEVSDGTTPPPPLQQQQPQQPQQPQDAGPNEGTAGVDATQGKDVGHSDNGHRQRSDRSSEPFHVDEAKLVSSVLEKLQMSERDLATSGSRPATRHSRTGSRHARTRTSGQSSTTSTTHLGHHYTTDPPSSASYFGLPDVADEHPGHDDDLALSYGLHTSQRNPLGVRGTHSATSIQDGGPTAPIDSGYRPSSRDAPRRRHHLKHTTSASTIAAATATATGSSSSSAGGGGSGGVVLPPLGPSASVTSTTSMSHPQHQQQHQQHQRPRSRSVSDNVRINALPAHIRPADMLAILHPSRPSSAAAVVFGSGSDDEDENGDERGDGGVYGDDDVEGTAQQHDQQHEQQQHRVSGRDVLSSRASSHLPEYAGSVVHPNWSAGNVLASTNISSALTLSHHTSSIGSSSMGSLHRSSSCSTLAPPHHHQPPQTAPSTTDVLDAENEYGRAAMNRCWSTVASRGSVTMAPLFAQSDTPASPPAGPLSATSLTDARRPTTPPSSERGHMRSAAGTAATHAGTAQHSHSPSTAAQRRRRNLRGARYTGGPAGVLMSAARSVSRSHRRAKERDDAMDKRSKVDAVEDGKREAMAHRISTAIADRAHLDRDKSTHQSLLDTMAEARGEEDRERHERVRQQREERAMQHMKAMNRWDIDRMLKQTDRVIMRRRVHESLSRAQFEDLERRRAAVQRVRHHKQFVQAASRNHRMRETWHGKYAVPPRATLAPAPVQSTTYDSPGLNRRSQARELSPLRVDHRYWQYLSQERVRDSLQGQLRSSWQDVDSIVRRESKHMPATHSDDGSQPSSRADSVQSFVSHPDIEPPSMHPTMPALRSAPLLRRQNSSEKRALGHSSHPPAPPSPSSSSSHALLRCTSRPSSS